uniref:Carboxypeptidase inhibitor n=1 Tax=Rhipicephalus zambeziensis TaxID=60191 RepID=A0A224Y2N9_9ACAR
MYLVSLIFGVCVASSALARFAPKRPRCIGSYGCVPVPRCPTRYMVPTRSGCKGMSTCCNLRKRDTCPMVGGTCQNRCDFENIQAKCPGRTRCCIYLDR